MNVNEVIANRAQVLKGFNMKANNLLKPMMMSINHNLQNDTSQQECILPAYKAVVEVTIPEKLRDTLHARPLSLIRS
jgi:fumarate hydratase class II